MDNIALLKWRDAQRLIEDEAVAAHFAARAGEVRQKVEFLLAGGLTEGAEAALAAFAEEDMVDFSIMVDLAANVAIDGVDSLAGDTRQHLVEFLDNEPWHSLATDLDITVVLAMIEDVLQHEGRWYETSPQLTLTLATLMDRVNRDQFQRIEAEIHERVGRHATADESTTEMIDSLVHVGAQRLGIRPRQP